MMSGVLLSQHETLPQTPEKCKGRITSRDWGNPDLPAAWLGLRAPASGQAH